MITYVNGYSKIKLQIHMQPYTSTYTFTFHIYFIISYQDLI